MKQRISKRSVSRLPRSAAIIASTTPEVDWVLIPSYTVIVTDMKRYSFTNVRR